MFARRLTLALAALAGAAVLEGLAALWALNVANNHVQRGRVASDIELAFKDLTVSKLRLRAWLPRTLLPDTPGAVGLSAVIETLDGQLSHWALHHPRADRPDFHHRAGWTAHPPLSPAPSSA